MTYTQKFIEMTNQLRKNGIPVKLENNTAYLTGTPYAFETGSTVKVYDEDTIIHEFKYPKNALKYMEEITNEYNAK